MHFINELLDYDYRESTRLPRLVVLSLFVHTVLFYGTVDIMFSTTTFQGLPSYGSNISLSKRVVIFVSDGLQADALYREGSAPHAPFLTETKNSKAAWGISHTQTPTKLYPGHITIFSGKYEDPHSITKRLNLDPIDFDHIFNQSSFSYLFGNPDIIKMFNKDNLGNIYSDFHVQLHPNYTDQHLATLVDKWVFKRVKIFLEQNEHIKHQEKSIFFLHLSGMDIISQLYHRNSKEYNENLMVVDNGVEEIVNTMDEFFNDDSTTYIFTSDRGMTNLDSEKYSFSEETEAPFLIWGANVKTNAIRQDLKQADITAIISGLLGINNPINSVGIFRDEFFNISDEDKAAILYPNTLTLLEQYTESYKRLKGNLLTLSSEPIKDFEGINDSDGVVLSMMRNGSYEEVNEQFKNLAEAITKRKEKMVELWKIPMMICLTIGLVLFMVYTLGMVVELPTYDDKPVRKFKWNLFLICFSIILIIVVGLNVHNVGLRNWFYVAFPLLVMLFVVYEWQQLQYFFGVILTAKLTDIVAYPLIICIVYVLGMTLIYKSYITDISLGIMVWMFIITFNQERFSDGILLAVMAIVFPTFYKESYNYEFHNGMIATLAVIFVMYLLTSVALKGTSYSPGVETNYFHQTVIVMQIICFCFSLINILITSKLNGVSGLSTAYVNVTSWIVLVVSLFLAVLHPRTLIQRSTGISVSLFNIFFLMSFNGESLFLALFMWMLQIWTKIEFEKIEDNPDYTVPLAYEFNSRYHRFDKCIGFVEYRRAFIYMLFVLISFFGVGNSTNLTSFDLTCTKCFLNTFDPVLTTILIAFKLTIPIFITTSSFLAINVFRRIPIIMTFSIIMFYSDIFVLHMMLAIKNTGSSLSIGTSISRFLFAIALQMAVLAIYTVLSYLSENEIFDHLSAWFHDWIGVEVETVEENKALLSEESEIVPSERVSSERLPSERLPSVRVPSEIQARPSSISLGNTLSNVSSRILDENDEGAN